MKREERKKRREEKYFSVPVFERFEVGLFLSFTGGVLDAYTYVARGGVFANAQTANIILFALNLCELHFLSALKYVVPIVCFVFGVLISEFILSRQLQKGAKLANYVTLLVLEAAVLVGVAFMPFEEDWNSIPRFERWKTCRWQRRFVRATFARLRNIFTAPQRKKARINSPYP